MSAVPNLLGSDDAARVLSPKSLLRSLLESLESPRFVAFWAKLINPRPADFTWGRAGSILVVKLDDLGDFVLATPFLRELRRAAPQARITLLVKPAVAALAETCPYVDAVLVFDGNTAGLSAWVFRRQLRALRFARRHLRPARFDVAIVPRWGIDVYHATHLAAYSGARATVSYTESATFLRARYNRGYDTLLTHPVPSAGRGGHEVTITLGLVESFGGTVATDALELWLTDSDRAFAAAHLPVGRDYAAICPGAADPLRRWPAAHFSALADWLRSVHGLTPILVGSAHDPAFPCEFSFLGKATLRQSVALLARCRLFVGNDSGPKHLAAAVRTPVIEVSALRTGLDSNHTNSPARFHAWGVPHRVVQPPPGAGDLAVAEVSFAAVRAATASLLAELAAGSAHVR